MNWRIISTLIAKDFSLFFRKKMFTVLTVIGLVFYIIIYFVLPVSVEEDLEIGLYSPVSIPSFTQMEEEGLKIVPAASSEELQEGVADGDYVAGVSLPDDIIEKISSGQKPAVSIYFTPDVPDEMKDTVALIIREAFYLQTGQALNIDVSEEILGPDMTGEQIPPRDRLRPLFAVIIILVEMMGLANLISDEVERRTIYALLVTPMSAKDLFLAKGITGTLLAFGQAVLFMLIVGGFSHGPLIILVSLLLGAILVTGAAFLISSVSKDFMSVLAWSIPVFILLAVPSFSILFPGMITNWIKILPSHYMVDTVHRVANFGSGWGDIWPNLLILLGYCVVITWIGIFTLKRRVR
jgi:ABC-type transport system involved in multi-copper enzyme maturation permease subunit